ncbi:Serine/threonine-protein kinase MARK2 [Myotis davidii]|uniref:Serine/threonine-protein kinase MARK2 n=1 Tax=Myotis davidii TaxID=225400 RepID=L5LY60_MYODS|nr:Serine/threonine-protein kinase MARK2 [Myotis davidii]
MEEVMEDAWLNMGQEEEPLRPYIELPQEDLDLRITTMMLDLGFKQEEIQHSVKQRTFDKVMGTYRILRVTQTKMLGRTIPEVGESFDGKTEQPSNPLDCPGSKMTIPPPNLVETISTTPPADPPEFKTATPSPILKLGPGGFPTMGNSSHRSTFIRVGAPGGAVHESGLHTGQADGGNTVSPSGTAWAGPRGLERL